MRSICLRYVVDIAILSEFGRFVRNSAVWLLVHATPSSGRNVAYLINVFDRYPVRINVHLGRNQIRINQYF
jgi:hypothetical protein